MFYVDNNADICKLKKKILPFINDVNFMHDIPKI